MLDRIRARLTYANVVATLALVGVIAGGTAYAANTIFSGDIVDGQVKTPDLAAAAVTTERIAGAAVTSDKVKDNTLAGRDVLDDSLKGADIDESTLSGIGGGGAGTPEAWHTVGAASTTSNRCADTSVTGVFCSNVDVPNNSAIEPWRNYGGTFSPAAFYKDQGGVVHLKGLVQNTELSPSQVVNEYPIFRLPPAYRPATRRVFASIGSEPVSETPIVQGRIDVQTNGFVTLIQGCGIEEFSGNSEDCSSTGGDITLDGITFRPSG